MANFCALKYEIAQSFFMNNILIELGAVKQEVWIPAYQRLVWLFALLMSPTDCIPNKELHELRWILLAINLKSCYCQNKIHVLYFQLLYLLTYY